MSKRNGAWFNREVRVADRKAAAVTRAASFDKIARKETCELPHESEDSNHIQRIFDYFDRMEKVHLGIAKEQ